MNENMKNVFYFALIAFLGFTVYIGISFVGAYSKSIQPSSFRSFSVSAEGKSVSVPDVAEFSFSVITEGKKDVAAIQKTNTEKMNKAIGFLKENKINPKDIKTESYDLSPRYQYYDCTTNGVCPPSEIVGYTLTQSVEVKIRDFNKIGDVISGVVKNGANSVSQLNFTIDDPTKVQDAAREEAIKKAQEKAKAIARAGGFDMGRLLSIEEGGGVPSIMPMYDYAKGGGMEKAMAVPTPAIEPGSKETRVTVTLKYEIE